MNTAVSFDQDSAPANQLPGLRARWQTSASALTSILQSMQDCGAIPTCIEAGCLDADGTMVLGGKAGSRAELQPMIVHFDGVAPGSARVSLAMARGGICFQNGFDRDGGVLHLPVAGWRLEFTAGVTERGGLALHTVLCDVERSHLPCDNAALKTFFISAVTVWLRDQADIVMEHTEGRRAVIARNDFLQHYLQGLLVDPIEARLNGLPNFVFSREGIVPINAKESQNEKSGVVATIRSDARARFVTSPTGWLYRDHVLLAWEEANRTLHDRESEQDLQCAVILASQPDADGKQCPTVDIHCTLSRYEWDSVKQELPVSRQCSYMGKAWARATLQWSLRLQWVVQDGDVKLAITGRKAIPATDSATTGIYVVSDPLPHLLNVHRIGLWWEGHAASQAAVRDGVASPLSTASSAVFARVAESLAPGSGLRCQGLRVDEHGDIEIALGE